MRSIARHLHLRSRTWRRASVALVAAIAMTAPAVLSAAPAQAAWGTQYSVTIQVNGAGQQLGRAEGWVQFDDGGDKFRYSFTICRQSSYTPPSMNIYVNASWVGGTWRHTRVAFIPGSSSGGFGDPPCYGGSQTASGEVTYANHWNVEIVLTGNTFIGSAFTTFDQDRILNNPY